jgi:hypothetical protein
MVRCPPCNPYIGINGLSVRMPSPVIRIKKQRMDADKNFIPLTMLFLPYLLFVL